MRKRKYKRRNCSPKQQFRRSKEWKDFRLHMAEIFGHRDYITGKSLSKGYHVHHLKSNQEVENYCDISNDSNFLPLNPYSHKFLHYIFTYYKKDPSILARLKEILDKMLVLSMSDVKSCIIENRTIDSDGEISNTDTTTK